MEEGEFARWVEEQVSPLDLAERDRWSDKFDSKFFNKMYPCVSCWLDNVERKFGKDIALILASFVDRSLRGLRDLDLSKFIPYGSYYLFEQLVSKEKLRGYPHGRDKEYKVKPFLIVLYGGKQSGKTTWCRYVVKKIYGHEKEFLIYAFYIEVPLNEILTKWVDKADVIIDALIKGLKEDLVEERNTLLFVVIDKADVMFKYLKPSEGINFKRFKAVTKLVDGLHTILTGDYLAVIVFETNSRNIITEVGKVFEDVAFTWFEVQPLPHHIKLEILIKDLHEMIEKIRGFTTVLGELTKFRAWLSGTTHIQFCIGEEISEKSLKPSDIEKLVTHLEFGWSTPVFPYDADYLIGLLTAWGWNPLNPDTELYYSFRKAVKVWDPKNPIYRIYAKVLLTEVELYSKFIADKTKVPKPFFKAYEILRKGFEDYVKLHRDMYVNAEKMASKLAQSVFTAYKDTDEDAGYLADNIYYYDFERLSTKTIIWLFADSRLRSLFTHPVVPLFLYLSLAKYSISFEFIQLVNDVMSLSAPVIWGIRTVLAPPILGTPKYVANPYKLAELLRLRLNYYNKLVVHELKSGKLLEPLRIMYQEPNLSSAWGEALNSVSKLPEDYQPLIKLPLVVLKELHPALHTPNPEKKAEVLYEKVSNREELIERMWGTAEELGITKDIYFLIRSPEGCAYVRDKFAMYRASLILDVNLPYYIRDNPFLPKMFIPKGVVNVISSMKRRS